MAQQAAEVQAVVQALVLRVAVAALLETVARVVTELLAVQVVRAVQVALPYLLLLLSLLTT